MGKTQNAQIVDIDLSSLRKKRFRVDGDDNRIVELNTSDLNILSRLREAYPRLISLAQKAFKDVPEINVGVEEYDFETDEATDKLITSLKEADTEMRKLVDYIFDSNVSEICAPSGSMYDPINGEFRFERILSVLANLYETNVSDELTKISNRVKKHTSKYTGR